MHDWMNTIYVDAYTDQIEIYIIPIVIQIIEIMCILVHYILFCLIYRFETLSDDDDVRMHFERLVVINDIVLILVIVGHMIGYYYFTTKAQKRIKLLNNRYHSANLDKLRSNSMSIGVSNDFNLVRYTFYIAWQNYFNNEKNLLNNQHCWGFFWWYDTFIDCSTDSTQASKIQYVLIPSYYIIIAVLLLINITETYASSKSTIIVIDNIMLCLILIGYLSAMLNYLVFSPLNNIHNPKIAIATDKNNPYISVKTPTTAIDQAHMMISTMISNPKKIIKLSQYQLYHIVLWLLF